MISAPSFYHATFSIILYEISDVLSFISTLASCTGERLQRRQCECAKWIHTPKTHTQMVSNFDSISVSDSIHLIECHKQQTEHKSNSIYRCLIDKYFDFISATCTTQTTFAKTLIKDNRIRYKFHCFMHTNQSDVRQIFVRFGFSDFLFFFKFIYFPYELCVPYITCCQTNTARWG